MRRVLIVLPAISRQGGGVSEAVRNLAGSLAGETEITLRILTARDGDFDADRCNWATHQVEAFTFFGPRGFRFSPGLFWRVLSAPADVVHLHGLWTFMGFAVFLRGLVRRTPYIVSPHGMAEAVVLARSPRRKKLFGWLYQNALLRKAAALHALTAAEARDVGKIAPETPVLVVPNCVDTQDTDGIRPGWWSPAFETRRVFVFLGRIHQAKGWRALLEGWALACRAGPDFCAGSQLVFCGWTDRTTDFETVVAGAQESLGNVLYAGAQFMADRARTLSAAHLLVLPSETEGLPMTVLEAWACGTPVMMTRACNLKQGFARGAALEIGGDPESIAAGLLQGFALSPARRAEMAVAGQGLIEKEFSPRRVARAFARAYAAIALRETVTPDGRKSSAAAGAPALRDRG